MMAIFPAPAVRLSPFFRTFAPAMKPLISFIITYHDEPETFLQTCLDSICALPLREGEGEVIIVDDGSDVPFSSLFHERGDFMVFRQEQAGLSAARNTGLSHASGRYIQFVDADDCLIPSAYEVVLNQVRSEQADVVMFWETKTNRHWREKLIPWINICGKRCSVNKEEWTGSSFLQNSNLRAAAWGYAFRREVLGDLRFCPGLLHEDELFTPLLFLRADTLVDLRVKAYFYRQHSGTITSSKSSVKIQRRLNDIHCIISKLKSYNNPLLERRVRQLTVDYLQKAWTQTHSIGELYRRCRELRTEGLLPLPLKCYSLRYLLASFLFRFCL